MRACALSAAVVVGAVVSIQVSHAAHVIKDAGSYPTMFYWRADNTPSTDRNALVCTERTRARPRTPNVPRTNRLSITIRTHIIQMAGWLTPPDTVQMRLIT